MPGDSPSAPNLDPVGTGRASEDRHEVEVDGRHLRLTNLSKVLYPATGFTKADSLDYYRRVAPVLLPWLARRPVTFRRFPDGVEGPSFYEKHLPRGAPEWVATIEVPSRSDPGTTSRYPAIDGSAALLWAANLAVLELHVPMWRAGRDGRPARPDLLVFDLDPGEGTGLPQCCALACRIRERLAADGYEPLPKTSGSKGLQLYARRPPARRRGDPNEYARAIAEQLQQERPREVVANMRRDLRPGKVLVDWSQNSLAKTTVAPYSLRARAEPRVSTPLTWDEVETVARGGDEGALAFEPEAVLARVEARGDLFAPLLG